MSDDSKDRRQTLARQYAAEVFTKTGINTPDLERLATWSVKAADAWIALEKLIDAEVSK